MSQSSLDDLLFEALKSASTNAMTAECLAMKTILAIQSVSKELSGDERRHVRKCQLCRRRIAIAAREKEAIDLTAKNQPMVIEETLTAEVEPIDFSEILDEDLPSLPSRKAMEGSGEHVKPLALSVRVPDSEESSRAVQELSEIVGDHTSEQTDPTQVSDQAPKKQPEFAQQESALRHAIIDQIAQLSGIVDRIESNNDRLRYEAERASRELQQIRGRLLDMQRLINS